MIPLEQPCLLMTAIHVLTVRLGYKKKMAKNVYLLTVVNFVSTDYVCGKLSDKNETVTTKFLFISEMYYLEFWNYIGLTYF